MGSNLLKCFFSDIGEELTIKEVQRRSGLTYKPVYFGLLKLAEKDYLEHRREKWKHFFKLNVANTFVRKELELVEIERREKLLSELDEAQRTALGELLEKAQELVPLLTVRIIDYTSFAQGKIKLFFVVTDEDGYISKIKNLCDELSRVHGVQLAAVTAPLHVFRYILAGEAELKPMLESGISVFGTEFFMREKVRTLVGEEKEEAVEEMEEGGG